MIDTGLPAKVRAVARTAGAAAGVRALTGGRTAPPWSVMDESLTKARMAREWLDAFDSVCPPTSVPD